MKHSIRHGLLLALVATLASAAVSAESIRSERGDVPITAPSVESEPARVINDKEPVPVAFEQQPPLVPHKTERYQVSLTTNECLDCHSKETAREKNATEVSESHYLTREGKQLDGLAPRRYFCTQCHVPQLDTDPLIDNVFQPLAAQSR